MNLDLLYEFSVLASLNSVSKGVSHFFRLAQGLMAAGIQMIQHPIIHATSVVH